jgi:hypothetical protein
MRRISGLLSGIPVTLSVAPAVTVPAVPAAEFDRVLSFNIVAIALEFLVRNDQPASSRSRSQRIRAVSCGFGAGKTSVLLLPVLGVLLAIDQSGLKASIAADGC